MKRQTDKGAALISAVLVMMLMSALLVGLMALVIADQQALGSGNTQTQAYMGAHAGLEKLTADLGALFKSNFSPTGAQVNALVDSSHTPTLSNGLTFVKPSGVSGYSISFTPDASGNPAVDVPTGSQITEGPYQGLIGLITQYKMDVTARMPIGSEARLTRTVQTVAIPVFQFGIFSDKDLSFHAGPDFSFGGRVHTNQNLYLAHQAGATLVLGDRVTAVGEVVRSHLASGRDISASGHTGTVRIATTLNGCAVWTSTTCRALAWTSATNNEGSVLVSTLGSGLGNVPPSTLQVVNGDKQMVRVAGDTLNTAKWSAVSPSAYNGYLLDGVYRRNADGTTTSEGTGARRLELPIVDTDTGAEALDLIRRPKAGDATGPGTTFDQRFFRLASLRIMLSDNASDISNLPTVTTTAPVDLSALDNTGNPYSYVVDNTHPPIAKTNGSGTVGMNANQKLITGFLKIEKQDNAGVWTDVTMEILNLGFAGRSLSTGTQDSPQAPGVGACAERSPDAVIRFERLSDTVTTCGVSSGTWTNTTSNYIPMALYDAREGAYREGDTTGIRLGGIMHYVELDVDNLRRWLNGTIGSTGSTNTMNVTGYVVYFSDRRGNRNPALATTSKETGELGWEDFVTPGNGVMDTGEDVNGDGVQQMYGNTMVPPTGSRGYLASGSNLRTVIDTTLVGTGNVTVNARNNPPAFFRRALKMVHGGRGNLPANGAQGLTVASENPVYVEGNYNACGSAYTSCSSNGFTDIAGSAHVSSAVIADAVTLLSRSWNDINSFVSPHAAGGRVASTTWYRLAIISGKGISFPYEVFSTPGPEPDRGSDGGVHNFLRYIENWGGSTLNYWGSMVSLYYNRQATGVFKCCGNVYSPPTRAYQFDNDFLTPGLLPPRTPMFRDINVLTFRESFIPTNP